MRISDWSSDVCSSDLIGMAEKARLQALQVVEAPHAPEAHGVAAGARRRRGRALRGPGQFLLGQLPCRARVSRLLVDRHGNSLAHRRATPLEEIALRESPRTAAARRR